MAGTRIDVEVMSHAWVLVRPARDAAASWDPPAAPARFSMELPNCTVGATIALVGEALRTEPTVDVIKLDHMWDRPLRFAHLWRTADAGSVFSLQWRAGKYRPDLEVSHSLSVDGVLSSQIPSRPRMTAIGLTGR